MGKLRAKVARRVAPGVALAIVFGALAAAPAGAQPAFIAYTGGASPTTTTVILNGYVATGGLGTVWAFEYGTGSGYGQATVPAVIAGRMGTVEVEALITGLKSGTTYHYRLDAIPTSVFGAGTATVGRDARFTTSKPPARRRPTKRR